MPPAYVVALAVAVIIIAWQAFLLHLSEKVIEKNTEMADAAAKSADAALKSVDVAQHLVESNNALFENIKEQNDLILQMLDNQACRLSLLEKVDGHHQR